MRRVQFAVAAVLVLLLLPAVVAQPQAPPSPPPFQNLQVLPDDIPREQLVDTMKGFTRALGVRCSHCHVGEGNDLSTYDFPSDAKHEKRAARVMIEMVQAINRDHLPRLAAIEGHHEGHEEGHHPAHAEGHEAAHPAGHAEGHEAGHAEAHEMARVTCMTCHRGEPEPVIEAAPVAGAAPPGAPPAPEAPEPPPPPPGG